MQLFDSTFFLQDVMDFPSGALDGKLVLHQEGITTHCQILRAHSESTGKWPNLGCVMETLRTVKMRLLKRGDPFM